jgi:hypothetical protein
MKFGRHQAHAPDDHRDNEQIVELMRLPSRFAADVVVAALDARGIKAAAVHSDAGGWAPHLSAYVGHRVMVFENDVETARALLVEEGLDNEALNAEGD